MKKKTREILIWLKGYALGAKDMESDYNTACAFETIVNVIQQAIDEDKEETEDECAHGV